MGWIHGNNNRKQNTLQEDLMILFANYANNPDTLVNKEFNSKKYAFIACDYADKTLNYYPEKTKKLLYCLKYSLKDFKEICKRYNEISEKRLDDSCLAFSYLEKIILKKDCITSSINHKTFWNDVNQYIKENNDRRDDILLAEQNKIEKHKKYFESMPTNKQKGFISAQEYSQENWDDPENAPCIKKYLPLSTEDIFALEYALTEAEFNPYM